MKKIKFIISGLLCAASLILNGATYYVATDGNNSGNGSIDNPWKTISASVSKLKKGDVLRVKYGVYNETSKVIITKSNVSIMADDPLNRPTIDFQDSDNPSGNFVDGYGQSNITWDGINIKNAGGSDKGAIDASIWNSTNNPTPISGWTIRNCAIEYAYNAAIRLYFCNNVVVENVTAFQCAQMNADRKNTNNHPHIILGFWADNVTIRNSSVIQGHGEGVGPYIDCDKWVIENCTIADNYVINVYVDTEKGNCIVRNNLIYNTDYSVAGGTSNQRASGIRIANEISDFQGWGGMYDPTKYLVENVEIYNNIILNCNTGIEAFPYDNGPFSLSNSMICNNTIVGTINNKNGLYIPVKGVKDIKNNIVYNTGGILLNPEAKAFANYTANPVFTVGTGIIAENYQLKPNSLCLDSGENISAILTDYTGTKRPVNAKFDIGAFEMDFDEEKTNISPTNPHFQFTGRIDFSDQNKPLLYYSGSYIKTKFQGTSLAATFIDQANQNSIGFIIDQEEMIVKTNWGTNVATSKSIVSNLKDTIHSLTIVKRTPVGNKAIWFKGLTLDEGKKLVAAEQKPQKRIEVFGNSISAGVNADNLLDVEGPADGSMDNGWNSFVMIASRMLYADCQNNGIPGLGVMTSHTYFSPGLESTYKDLSPYSGYETPWNFDNYNPQLVIMPMGVNDDGLVPDNEKNVWKEKYKSIVSDLMSNKYPAAHFIFTVPPMGIDRTRMEGWVQEIVTEINNPRVHFYNFLCQPSKAHPNKIKHEEMALELYSFITSLSIDWNQSLPVAHNLTITNGTGSGKYVMNTSVTIKANTPPEGQYFHEWTGDTEKLNDVYSSTTSLKMPDSDVNLTASYGPFIELAEIKISPAEVNIYTTGDPRYPLSYFKMELTYVPLNATNKHITWISDDSSIATVDSTGLVKAVSTGITIVKALSANGKVFSSSKVIVSDASPLPYKGLYHLIPGVFQAEDYSEGGEGIAYHDDDMTNNGTSYRLNEAVDIQPTTDRGGGFNLAWMRNSEWIYYSVNVKKTGTYKVKLRVASTNADGKLKLTFSGNGTSCNFNVPNSGGWQTWKTVENAKVLLSEGQQLMKLDVNTGALNLNYFDISVVDTITSSLLFPSDTNFSFFPNPCNGILNFEFHSFEEPISISILNVLGEVVYSHAYRKEDTICIDLRDKNDGLYFVTFKSGNFQKTKKLLLRKI